MTIEAAPIFRSAAALHRHLEIIDGDVVLAHGCFDPLHVAHIRYLREAKQHASYLVVAVNDDASTRRSKGAGRPILRAADRAKLIASLDIVDAVVVFGGSIGHLLKQVHPGVYAKRAEEKGSDVPSLAGVRTVEIARTTPHSSDDIVRRIRRPRGG